MRLGVKRLDEHGQRCLHIVDPPTSRGLILFCDSEANIWEWVKKQDVDDINGYKDITEFLINNEYLPREIPDQEFNGLYNKIISRNNLPLFRNMEDFDPSETPVIGEIVGQNSIEYIASFVKQLSSSRYSE